MRGPPTGKPAGSRTDEDKGHPPRWVAVAGYRGPYRLLPGGLGTPIGGEDRHARYLRAASTEHHILSLHPADRCGLHHLAFSLDGREAVDAAAAELERRGTTLVAQPDDLDEPGGGYGLRFLDPENRCIELSAGVGRTPRTAGLPGKAPPAGCATWGLNTPCFEQIVSSTPISRVRVSDWIENQMVFLRCGRRHHIIVFNRADHAASTMSRT